MPATPLLTTKFFLPPIPSPLVLRPRLLSLLGPVAQRALTLISAPAGSGKTTLAAEWRQSETGQQAAFSWLALDADDRDPARFAAYLVGAIQRLGPSVGHSAAALLEAAPPTSLLAVMQALLHDLSTLNTPAVLALDDYHLMTAAPVHEALSYLLDHRPPHFGLMILTRHDPPFPLARLRVRQQLVEVRAEDLRFSASEADRFLKTQTEVALSASEITALGRRTEGWAAGLQLAALTLRSHPDPAAFVRAFSGSERLVSDYLVEEVLAQLPKETQQFLLRTSILGTFNASLCEAVSGIAGGATRLEELYRANLFLQPRDESGEWYCYHPLFAEFLRSRLVRTHPAAVIAQLYQHAAIWSAQAGSVEDAIHFAQSASDLDLAARLIEQHGLAFLLQARVRTVESWLSALPEPYVAERLRLLMVRAWLRLLSGTAPAAAGDLARLTASFDATPPEALDPGLHGEWLTLCARMQSAQGRAHESRDLAEAALSRLPDTASAIRTLAAVTLASAHATLLDYDRAAEIFERLVREARSREDFATEILSTSGQAQMSLLQGRLGAAYRIAIAGIERLEHSGRSTPFSATLYGELAQVHFDRHELDPARVYLRRSREASGAVGYRDPEMYERVALSRMCGMHGDREGAARECDHAVALARQFPPALVREEILAQQVRVALAAGLIRDAQTLLEAEGFSFVGAPQRPELVAGAPVTHAVGLLYNSVLRVWAARARSATAPVDVTDILQWAERVLAGELICRHVPVALETLLLMAQLYEACGAPADALARVEQALALAQPEGFISVFLEAGPPTLAVLTRVAERRSCPEPLRAHARTILAAVQGEPAAVRPVSPGVHGPVHPALVEPLTERERDVLKRIAAGDTNQEIANRLVISVSAVKKHTVNLYSKLGVHTRTQAVACARDLGLLTTT